MALRNVVPRMTLRMFKPGRQELSLVLLLALVDR